MRVHWCGHSKSATPGRFPPRNRLPPRRNRPPPSRNRLLPPKPPLPPQHNRPRQRPPQPPLARRRPFVFPLFNGHKVKS